MKITRVILLVIFSLISLSARDWNEIKKSKKLLVGIRVRPGVLEESKDKGFHYDLIKMFALKHRLKVELVIKQNISDYFGGTIFEECDVVVDNVTITPEREKKMDFVQIFPIKQVLVTRKDHEPIEKMKNLRKEKIIVTKGTSYYENIKRVEEEVGKKFKYHFSRTTGDQLKDLKAGKGTITILDSNLAMSIMESGIITHSAISKKQFIGWGVERGQVGLLKALNAFQDEIRKTGYIEKVWNKYILGIDYFNYMTVAGK